MSYRAIVDITLGIDSFRNVGMFQQGVYFLTYQLYYYKENKKIYGIPYANIPFIYSSDYSKENFKNIEPNEILDEERLFKTRMFCIRYKREEIPMNEVCQFRAEVDTDKDGDFKNTKFYIETNLYFLRFKFQSGTTLNFIQDLARCDKDKFKLVSTQSFLLTGCMYGMTEYLPTTFKGVYFSVSHGIIHTTLMDFKWRDQLLINITNDTDENGVYVENKFDLSDQEMQEMLFKYAYSPPCLEDYLLGDEKDFYEHNKPLN